VTENMTRLLDGLKITQGFLAMEKAKPDPQRSRPVVYAAQAAAEVLLRRLECERR
jgi:hypothetical protein